MKKQSLKEQERDEAIARLKELIKPGDTIHTVLRSVSRSGMTRKIDLYVFKSSGNEYAKYYISYLVAKALDYRQDVSGAVIVGGTGMDMGYHLVYSLSRVLFRDSFTCLGKHCPSNDHSNGMPRPDKAKKSIKHSDGGYALRHEWI